MVTKFCLVLELFHNITDMRTDPKFAHIIKLCYKDNPSRKFLRLTRVSMQKIDIQVRAHDD